MSGETSVTKSSRSDENQTVIGYIEILQDHQLSKLERRIDIHTTRSRGGGSLAEEVMEKLERFKIRTVNILVGGDDGEQKK
ncbi:hypothetical protein CARUB_v10024438mg [Capsella rubella]|uniref:Uncharacterized protein n=1 Tax=Capsella rubella TaxID=81985 RepID=R0HSA9_9BRAS|nr:uncharacterized protein LOC17888982 [Capsella rubella]EOA28245.1 hypothetical protein CARUB_v10024438mg [Capsella rubella]